MRRVRGARSGVWGGACLVLSACASGEIPDRLGAAALALVPAEAGAADAGAGELASDAATTPGHDCCTGSSAVGCNDPAVEACVCAGDPFCCAVEYDALCATQAVSRCDVRCDVRPATSDCCGPSDVPGCTQPEGEACICDIDPFCCVFRFDQNCVNLGRSRCGTGCGEEARP